MTATDELRKLLDERGVEYYKHEDGEPLRELHEGRDDATSWRVGGANVCAVPFDDYTFDLWIDHATPEQAIAATLGRGECILHECEGSFSAVNRPVWLCDCGAFVTQYTDATTYHKPRFCPNCGRRVKGGSNGRNMRR